MINDKVLKLIQHPTIEAICEQVEKASESDPFPGAGKKTQYEVNYGCYPTMQRMESNTASGWIKNGIG